MKKLAILSVAIVTIISLSCEKMKSKCRYKDLGEISCPKNHVQLLNTVVYNGYTVGSFCFDHNNSNITLKNDSDYIYFFGGKHIFGSIDFSKNWLIGIYVYTNPAKTFKSKSSVFSDTKASKIRFIVEYSLEDQCKGSGISNQEFETWAIVPNYSNAADITFSIIDVNPYH